MTKKAPGEIDFKRLHRPGRYVVTKSGYVIDRYAFRLFSVVFLSIALIMLASDLYHGTETKAFVSCPEDAIGGFCTNPLYGKCDLPACEKERLIAGKQIGEPYNGEIENFCYFMLLFLGITILYNHMSQKTEGYENARNSYNKPIKKGKSRTRKEPTRNARS